MTDECRNCNQTRFVCALCRLCEDCHNHPMVDERGRG